MKFSLQTLAIALSIVEGSSQVLRRNRQKRKLQTSQSMSMLTAEANDDITPLLELAGDLGEASDNIDPYMYSGSSKSGKSCKSQKELPPLISRVYTASNQGNDNNEVNIYERDLHTGKLSFIKSVATGGSGDQLSSPPSPPGGPAAVDDPLASTGSVVVAGKCLLVVNAGSNEISSFSINEQNELELLHGELVSSGGDFPVSIAERDGLVYVLNVGGDGAIQGYDLKQYNCRLFPIDGAIALSQDVDPLDELILTATPAQVGFTPEGNILVSIKQNGGGNPNLTDQAGSLNLYEIDPSDGTTSAGMLTQTNLTTSGGFGTIPFSFTSDDEGNLLLVEVAGAAAVLPPENGGQVNVISDIDTPSPMVGSEEPTDSAASCWIEYNPLLSCVYVTNNVGSSISSFTLSDEQELDLVSNETALLNAPIDMVQSPDYKYLYALSTGHTGETEQTPLGQPSIYVYEMECDCTLKEIQVVTDGFLNETARIDADGEVNGYAGLSMFTGLLN